MIATGISGLRQGRNDKQGKGFPIRYTARDRKEVDFYGR